MDSNHWHADSESAVLPTELLLNKMAILKGLEPSFTRRQRVAFPDGNRTKNSYWLLQSSATISLWQIEIKIELATMDSSGHTLYPTSTTNSADRRWKRGSHLLSLYARWVMEAGVGFERHDFQFMRLTGTTSSLSRYYGAPTRNRTPDDWLQNSCYTI